MLAHTDSGSNGTITWNHITGCKEAWNCGLEGGGVDGYGILLQLEAWNGL